MTLSTLQRHNLQVGIDAARSALSSTEDELRTVSPDRPRRRTHHLGRQERRIRDANAAIARFLPITSPSRLPGSFQPGRSRATGALGAQAGRAVVAGGHLLGRAARHLRHCRALAP